MTIFVYSGGKLVAEYSTQQNPNPQTSYTTSDHLNSPRVITNGQGQVTSRRDFMPFGTDAAISGSRSQANGYNSDTVRQKFTGYLKDEETNLEFAEARMYETRHGRFTAVDPLLASGKSANPQTFNRFVYVGNNPLTRIDPTRLCTTPPGLQKGQVGFCFEAFIAQPRVGVGGLGHGDNRTFAGNDPSKTARVTVWATVSRSEDGKKINIVQSSRVESSVVTVATPTEGGFNTAKTGNQSDGTISLQGTADTNVTTSNNNVLVTDKGFGKGIDVTLSIANGTNGGQQLGRDLQTTGIGVVGTSTNRAGQAAGTAVNVAGRVAEALAPAGTIDGNMTVRITGNGQVTKVGAETRGFPSYAGYTYTVGADGKVVTQEIFTRFENKIEDLTKPLTRVP